MVSSYSSLFYEAGSEDFTSGFFISLLSNPTPVQVVIYSVQRSPTPREGIGCMQPFKIYLIV